MAPNFEDVLQTTVQSGWNIYDIPEPVTGGPTINDTSDLDEIIEGLPTAIARCLSENSGSLDHLQALVKTFKATGEIPQVKFSRKPGCLGLLFGRI